MKILALEKECPGVRAEQFLPLLKEEARRVWDLQQSGLVREIYFSDKHTAVLVLECADPETAGQILSRLPLVQAGLIDFALIPLVPYDGFARLFDRSNTSLINGEGSHGPAQ